jgi:hypothetical protein
MKRFIFYLIFLPITAFGVVGTYTSAPFDTGGASHFGSLTWHPATQSASCSLKFQIATNDNNKTWEFLGPDGSVSSYYTQTPSAIWQGHNGNRYIKYRVILLSSDPAESPKLDRVVISYDVVLPQSLS